MRNTTKVMNVIARAGRPLTVVEMALMTGMDVDTLQRAVMNAKRTGYLSEMPATFNLTGNGVLVQTGRKTMGPKPKAPKQLVAAAAPKASEDVRRVVASQHPLASAWGATA